MRRSLKNVYRLGLKELNSLRRDPVLLFLLVFTFTFAIYTVATGVQTEVRNASIAIVDEDQSDLSRQIRAAFLKPYFKQPVLLGLEQIDPVMDAGLYAFVINIPPDFQADVLAGRRPRRSSCEASGRDRCARPPDRGLGPVRGRRLRRRCVYGR